MPTLEGIKLAVFDVDDTLYDEADFVEGGFRSVASSLAEDRVEIIESLVREMKSLLHDGRRDIFQAMLSKRQANFEAAKVSELVSLYRTSDRPLRLFADADRAVERFRETGIRLAVVTDGPFQAQRTKARLLDLGRRFDPIVYTDEFGSGFGKPCPHCFRLLMHRFKVRPCECVYIADNESKDFYGPNFLGWRSIKVARPGLLYHLRKMPGKAYKPFKTISDLDQLILCP